VTEEADAAPGPLSLAVAYATAGRAALQRHAEGEAILAYEHALPLAEAAVAAGVDGQHADLVRFLGYVHDVLGGLKLTRSDLDGAERHFTAALELSKELAPASADVAKFTSNLGSVARHRGDLMAALRLYRSAADLAVTLEPVPDALGTYLSNAGTALLGMGDYNGALGLFRRALEIEERADPAAAATDLSLIGSALLELGESDQARDHFERALAVHEALDPQSSDTARDLVNVGYCHRLAGDLDQALQRYFAALDIDRALGPASLETAGDLNNISQVYELRGNLGRAQDYLEEALEISRGAAPRSQRTARQLNNLGAMRRAAGRHAEARVALEEALVIDQAVAPQSADTARDLGNLGMLAVDQDNLELAEDYCHRALDLYHALGADTESVAAVLTTLSIAAYRRGDKESAMTHTRAAYEIDRRRVPDADQTATDLINLAFLHAENGELDEAITRYSEAVGIAESLRRQAGTAAAREERFALLQSPYQGLVRALFQRAADGDAARAFDVAERARGRTLADLLARGRIDMLPADGAQRSLLVKERQLEHELAAIDRRLASTGAANDADQRRRRSAAERLERLRMDMRTAFPAYARLREPQPLGLAAAQRLLPGDTVLLCYHAGEQGGVMWAVRKGDWSAGAIPVPRSLLSEQVDAALTACRAAEPETGKTLTAWRRLSRLLLGAVPAGWLTAAARVVVVADGPLLYLPFELLPHADGYLADTLTVCYAPSVTILAELAERGARARQAPAGRRFIGIGLTDTGPGDGLQPLPGAREVREIAGEYGAGARVITGPAATKDLILRETADYRVVHFATHGVIDDSEPLYSGLQVAADQAGGDDRPDVLHVYEMFSLNIPAAVVVCSACQTAHGRIRAGEGLVGMSRALFSAGAGALVVTLWAVPDVPTRRLMRVFHRHLRAGQDPARALALAKRDVRRSHPYVYRHPYTWAGFIALAA
jgi:tetratricopeptide (TPR) repeat protein